MKRASDRLYILLICAGLALATVIAFEPVRHNEFVNFDDDDYVTENPQVQAGLTSKSIVWAFTSSHSFNWHPMTWLSHMLDCKLFDLNPFWHHLTSLLFHIANVLLLFLVFVWMTNAVWPSAFVAAAFALHPLHVESVAWVAERKDVLSGFFWMLTMVAYVRYAKRPGVMRYLLVVMTLCLGLMAKPMMVTLPFALLLLDYWPLGRLRWEARNKEEDLKQYKLAQVSYRAASIYRLVGEKIPLFILAVISSVVTLFVQRSGGAIAQIENIPLNFRIANALVSYISYIGKMIYPIGLAVFYPISSDGLPVWQTIVSLVILLCISIGVIYVGWRYRFLAVGWLWYLGTLVPVIGLVQVGGQAMADRYTYLPATGIFIMVAWGAAEIPAKWRYQKAVLGITATAALAALLICTRMQVGYWQNSSALFRHALAVTQNNYVVHNNYGLLLREKGLPDEAITHFSEALRINPRSSIARINIGMAVLEQGRYDQAIAYLNEALRLRPDWPEAYHCLGVAYHQQGRYELAVQNYKQALQLGPDNPNIISKLAMALEKQGKIDQAISEWNRVLEFEPGHPDAHFHLGLNMVLQRRYDEAIKHFNQALRARLDWPDAYYYLGLAYAQQGKFELAIQNYKEALHINSEYADAHSNLGVALVRVGDFEQAIKHYTEALRLRPDWIDTMNNLAWILAAAEDTKFRNPTEAVKLAERACELIGYEQADLLDTLAVAYAAEGRFSQAIETAEKAIKLANQSSQKELAEEIQDRLQLYKAERPYIEKSSTLR